MIKRSLAFLLTLILSFQFAYFPTQALARVSPDPESFLPDEMNLDFLNPTQKLAPDDEQVIKDILNEPTQNILEIMYLLKKLHVKVDDLIKKTSLQDVAERVAKRRDIDAVAWEEKGVGKAELTSIGQGEYARFVTKVRHNGLKTTFLFVDKNQIQLSELERKPDSHLPQALYTQELKARKVLSKHWRNFLAQIILAEWNPKFVYTGMKSKEAAQKSIEPKISETDTEKLVKEITTSPATELEKKPWYQKLLKKKLPDIAISTDSKLDQAQALDDAEAEAEAKEVYKNRIQEKWHKLALESDQIAEAKIPKETVVVFYDSLSGEILNKEEYKPYDFNEFSVTSKTQVAKALEHCMMYWRAIWEPPSWNKEGWKNANTFGGKIKAALSGDYAQGLFFGVVLGALTYGVANLAPKSVPPGLTALGVAKISFYWSVFFGVFSRTWQKFVYRGNDFVRFCKNWMTGLGQSYHYNLMSDKSILVWHDHDWDAAAIKVHRDILINQSIKTYGKTPMQEWPKFREETGLAHGNVIFQDYIITFPNINNKLFQFEASVAPRDESGKLIVSQLPATALKNSFKFLLSPLKKYQPSLTPGKSKWVPVEPYDTFIPRKNFEGQLVQLFSTPISLLSRFGWEITMGLSWFTLSMNHYLDLNMTLNGFAFPLGHFLYLILGPAGKYMAMKKKVEYADLLEEMKSADHPEAERWRSVANKEIQEWKDYRIMGVPWTQPVGFYLKVVPKRVIATSKELFNWSIRKLAKWTYDPVYGDDSKDEIILTERGFETVQQGLKNISLNRCRSLFSAFE